MGEYHYYGVPFSYYSVILKVYLQYKRIPYIDHFADKDAYERVIMPRIGLQFIPVLVTPQDEALQDTSDVIDELERRHPSRPVQPSDPLLHLVTALLELYGQELLLFPGLHMRWNFERNLPVVYDHFGMMGTGTKTSMTPQARRSVGKAFSERITRFLPHMGLDNPSVQDTSRQAFDRFLTKLETLLGFH